MESIPILRARMCFTQRKTSFVIPDERLRGAKKLDRLITKYGHHHQVIADALKSATEFAFRKRADGHLSLLHKPHYSIIIKASMERSLLISIAELAIPSRASRDAAHGYFREGC